MSFRNKSGIKDIKINFNLKPLQNVLEVNPDFLVTEQTKKDLLDNVAREAKNNLIRGNFKNNIIKESTSNIRKWRGNEPNKPLVETGKLKDSIKPYKDGIEMEEYGEYHLKGYRIKSNKFTKAWNIKAGTRVPKRNFLEHIKGFGKSHDVGPQAKSEIKKRINNLIRTKMRTLR
jgi:phage gpG-like protein|tara:strand:- start:65 stop:586 length:522 start_codon:yes stop_codon:yes gene_type:complete